MLAKVLKFCNSVVPYLFIFFRFKLPRVKLFDAEHQNLHAINQCIGLYLFLSFFGLSKTNQYIGLYLFLINSSAGRSNLSLSLHLHRINTCRPAPFYRTVFIFSLIVHWTVPQSNSVALCEAYFSFLQEAFYIIYLYSR